MTTPGLAVARRQPLGVRSAVPQRPTTPRPLLRDRHRRRRDRRTPNGHGSWLRDVATDLLSRAVVPVHLFVSVRGPSSGCGIGECPGVREAETAGVTGVGKHDVDLTRSGTWGPPAYARSSIRSVTWPRPRSCSPASPGASPWPTAPTTSATTSTGSRSASSRTATTPRTCPAPPRPDAGSTVPWGRRPSPRRARGRTPG